MMPRNADIRVQLTALEKETIEAKAKAAGKSNSSFLRDLALSSISHTFYEGSQEPSQEPKLDRLEATLMAMQEQLTQLNQKLSQESSQSKNVCVAFEVGETITAQSSKRHGLLLRCQFIPQEVPAGWVVKRGKYRWYPDLGVVCMLKEFSRSEKPKYLVKWVLKPGQELSLTPEGGFIHSDGKIYLVREAQEIGQEVGQDATQELTQVTSQEPSQPIQEVSPEPQKTSQEPTQISSQEPSQPIDPRLTLSLDKLAERLAKKAEVDLFSVKGTLLAVGGTLQATGQKNKALKWTSERDPDSLGWLPSDTERSLWKAQEVSQKDSQEKTKTVQA
uniref:plasmid mobilization protein n=1 Tax=Trichocoleus desertorum TaxID=1481672 RepID=UPI0025B561A4|nr:hypothetical protein [Trichocoleus desertorum]